MNDEEKKQEELVNLTPQPLKVSKVIFDEATGTVTLKLASEEEIAEDERLKAMRNEQGAISNEKEKGKEA